MKRNLYSKKKYTKAKRKRVYTNAKPDFIISIKKLTLNDLKKLNLISSRDYREYIKSKIKKDYEGENVDETK